MSIGLVIDVLVKAMVVGFSLYPVVRPDSSHFAGKAMGVRAVLYPATTILIPVLWLVAGQPSPYPFVADIALGIPFALDAGANVLGLFAIKGFDAICTRSAGSACRSRSGWPSRHSSLSAGSCSGWCSALAR